MSRVHTIISWREKERTIRYIEASLIKYLNVDRSSENEDRFFYKLYCIIYLFNFHTLVAQYSAEIALIIGVADAYDAMSSNRSYRKAMDQSAVRSEIEKGSGSQFSPKFAAIMLQMIDEDINYDMREKE